MSDSFRVCLRQGFREWDRDLEKLLKAQQVITEAFGKNNGRTTLVIEALIALYEASQEPQKAAACRALLPGAGAAQK